MEQGGGDGQSQESELTGIEAPRSLAQDQQRNQERGMFADLQQNRGDGEAAKRSA
jgi:hypothetical protein